jgi:hypothetical protein
MTIFRLDFNELALKEIGLRRRWRMPKMLTSAFYHLTRPPEHGIFHLFFPSTSVVYQTRPVTDSRNMDNGKRGGRTIWPASMTI